jgi:hypothetical protein
MTAIDAEPQRFAERFSCKNRFCVLCGSALIVVRPVSAVR